MPAWTAPKARWLLPMLAVARVTAVPGA